MMRCKDVEAAALSVLERLVVSCAVLLSLWIVCHRVSLVIFSRESLEAKSTIFLLYSVTTLMLVKHHCREVLS